MLTKQEIFLGKGTRAESTRVREPRRTAVPCGLQSYVDKFLCCSFMLIGLISRLSLANHSDSESFLVVHTLFSQDGHQWEGFWEVVRHVVSPFDLSRTLLVGGGLLVPCSLPGPPVIKQLMQMVTMVPGQGGRFQSVCFLYTSKASFFLTMNSCLVYQFLSLQAKPTLSCFTVQSRMNAVPLAFHSWFNFRSWPAELGFICPSLFGDP